MFSDIPSLDNVLYFKYTSQNDLSKKLEKNILEAEENFLQSQKNLLAKVQKKRKNA